MQSTFSPTYHHPFNVQQATQLETITLVTEISRLANSINHLKSSNAQLVDYIQEGDEGDKGDAGEGEGEGEEENEELKSVVLENEEIIATQMERIELIKIALISQLGYDPTLDVSHRENTEDAQISVNTENQENERVVEEVAEELNPTHHISTPPSPSHQSGIHL